MVNLRAFVALVALALPTSLAILNFTGSVATRSLLRSETLGVDVPSLWSSQNKTFGTLLDVRKDAPLILESISATNQAVTNLATLVKESGMEGMQDTATPLGAIAIGLADLRDMLDISMMAVDFSVEL